MIIILNLVYTKLLQPQMSRVLKFQKPRCPAMELKALRVTNPSYNYIVISTKHSDFLTLTNLEIAGFCATGHLQGLRTLISCHLQTHLLQLVMSNDKIRL